MTLKILMACHNRRELTINCLRGLAMQEPCGAEPGYVVMDDGSTDGTAEAIDTEFPEVRVLKGDGSLYWCGGMRMAWKAAAEEDPDYYLLLNDDTLLHPDALRTIIRTSHGHSDAAIIVGAICDPDTGRATYGGVRRKSGLVEACGKDEVCDTFNANCVLIPRSVYQSIGGFHDRFTHGMGDFDYGLQATKRGIPVIQTGHYVGTCRTNSVAGTWNDRSLPRFKRLRLLQSPKGLPFQEWFVFITRNNGWRSPYYLLSPFIRILMGR